MTRKRHRNRNEVSLRKQTRKPASIHQLHQLKPIERINCYINKPNTMMINWNSKSICRILPGFKRGILQFQPQCSLAAGQIVQWSLAKFDFFWIESSNTNSSDSQCMSYVWMFVDFPLSLFSLSILIFNLQPLTPQLPQNSGPLNAYVCHSVLTCCPQEVQTFFWFPISPHLGKKRTQMPIGGTHEIMIFICLTK